MPPLGLIADSVYASTKSYAGKGALLSRPTIENLTEARDLEELILRLKATAYDEAVSRVEKPISASRIELAAREHVAKVHFDLIRISPSAPLLSASFLRYITLNLKTVLKGKALGKSFDDLRRHVDLYPEELIGRRDLINRALVTEGLDEAAAELGKNEFTQDVHMAISAYKNNKRLEVFDLYLDKAYYTNLSAVFSTLGGGKYSFGGGVTKVSDLISLDVDSHNILSVLRAKSWNISFNETKSLLIEPTYGISLQRLMKMASAEDVASAARYLESSLYRKILPSGGTDEVVLIGALEHSFKILSYEIASHPFVWDVFSDVLPFALTRLKELEMLTISAIAFGVEQNIEPREIQPKIIMPKK